MVGGENGVGAHGLTACHPMWLSVYEHNEYELAFIMHWTDEGLQSSQLPLTVPFRHVDVQLVLEHPSAYSSHAQKIWPDSCANTCSGAQLKLRYIRKVYGPPRYANADVPLVSAAGAGGGL
jgi:hypothetical protein